MRKRRLTNCTCPKHNPAGHAALVDLEDYRYSENLESHFEPTRYPMSLFHFELKTVEDIEPWGPPEEPSLSWFALTDGTFRINAGDQKLLEYSPEILAHWKTSTADADYQVAALAREVLGSFGHAIRPLPDTVELLVRNWALLEKLDEQCRDEPDNEGDQSYAAWRWLAERTPWMSYFAATPRISYLRVGDAVEIHWDNTKLLLDGIRVWTASRGTYALPVRDFVGECESFADRLLTAMKGRLVEIEAAKSVPRAPVNVASLWAQHELWKREFEQYLHDEPEPDISWPETQAALRSVAARVGIVLP